MLSNHAIMFSADTNDIDTSVTVNQVGDTYEIEYTFYYVHLNGVEYTMKFINSLTGTNVFKDSDGNTFTVDPITNETPAAVVTERFKNIAGYIPDEYQKRLILTATPENNVITFYYTESADPTYLIEHYTENPDGTWTIQASEFSSKPSGSSVSDVTRSFVGHTFNPDQTWVNAQNVELVQDTTYDIWAKNYTQGANDTYTAGSTLETGKTLVIRFYYPLTEYEYLFGENDEDSSRTYTAKYGQRVTANAKGVRDRALALGYWVDGKTGDDVDENDTFLFRVTNKGKSGEDSIDITVSIKGKGSAFITQIPMGEYEVEEISDWSWKYGTVEPQTASIPDKCTVTFTNTKNTSKKWLGGESSVNNKFSAAENNG